MVRLSSTWYYYRFCIGFRFGSAGSAGSAAWFYRPYNGSTCSNDSRGCDGSTSSVGSNDSTGSAGFDTSAGSVGYGGSIGSDGSAGFDGLLVL